MAATEFTLGAAARSAIIAAALEKVREQYVFPAMAEQIGREILRHQADGAYDDAVSGVDFAILLTAHLQETSRDRHLRISFDRKPQPLGDNIVPHPAQREQWRQLDAQRNHGFARVERLAGNIGLLELRQFARPEVAGDLAAAAMALLANTEALIIDLRQNRGGSPATVALLASYFFTAEPVHLNSLYWREGDRVQQWWTLPYLPSSRYVDKPVYVLTSNQTFSAAEEFAYDLQVLGRATIVGEVTGGGAHLERRYQLTPHFAINVPRGRALNPITGTNWEGVGVSPDVTVSAAEALPVTHAAALRQGVLHAIHSATGAGTVLLAEARAALAALTKETGYAAVINEG